MPRNSFFSFSFLLFVLFLYKASSDFNLNHLHTPQFQTRNFETAIEGKALNSSLVFLSLNIPNEEECMHKCLVYKDCFSYNLGPKQGELLICELCSKVRFGGEARLVNKTGYKHRSTVSSCSNKPLACSGQGIAVCIPNLQTTTTYQCLLLYVDIEVKGYGTDDPRGLNNDVYLDSYFKINGKKYPLSHADRGHTFRVITCNGDSVSVGPKNTFDTYGDSTAGSKMASFVSSIPAKSIVLALLADSGQNYADANALISLGATSPATFGYREAWAFIGFKGERKTWIVEKKTAMKSGPASVTARIPCSDLV